MKVGGILRVYAKDSSKAEATAKRAVKNALHLITMLDTVIVGVAIDSDCGLTVELLEKEFIKIPQVVVLPVNGDNSREVLNECVKSLASVKCDLALIISGKAVESLQKETVQMAKKEFANQNLSVVGVTLDEELNKLIELGFIQNTCAFWRVSHLLKVGGFTSKKGVEEMSVLVELLRQGHTSVVLLASEKELNVREDGKNRYEEVLRTKWERIDSELARVNANREHPQLLLSHSVKLN